MCDYGEFKSQCLILEKTLLYDLLHWERHAWLRCAGEDRRLDYDTVSNKASFILKTKTWLHQKNIQIQSEQGQ